MEINFFNTDPTYKDSRSSPLQCVVEYAYFNLYKTEGNKQNFCEIINAKKSNISAGLLLPLLGSNQGPFD